MYVVAGGGGGQGSLNVPLPVPFNPGSRPVFVGSHLFAFFHFFDFSLFLPPHATLGIPLPAPFYPGLPPPPVPPLR